MDQAGTVDGIERAALSGLRVITDATIAYTARRDDEIWTIGAELGLKGDVAGLVIPEATIPHAGVLQSGKAICYESGADMGEELKTALAGVGLGSLYAVPIMKAGVCTGALAIGQPGPSLFSSRDRAAVRLCTSHLSSLVAKRDLVQSLETMAESVPAIVLRTEPNGWINWYNHRWYSFTGQTHEEAAGWGWQTAHHPEDFLRVMEEWPRALATGEPIEIEFRLRRYDGVFHWHLARVEPIRDEKNKILSWYGTVVDIDAQKLALERSKRVAETLQEAFLPHELPKRPGLRIDVTYASAEEDARVGGDWYDAFELPDGRLGFSMGDVSGHGLAASLAVGKLRQAIYTLARRMDDPSELLAEVNAIFQNQEPEAFATALVGFVDPEGTKIRYAAAGHPPPIVAHVGESSGTTLPSGGLPLGISGEVGFKTHELQVAKDMVFVLYTDGVTEYARDAVAGEARLRAVVPSLVRNVGIDRPASFLYDATLCGAVAQDDAAIMVLQFSPPEMFVRNNEAAPRKEWRFHASDANAAHVARREIAAYIFETCGETEDARTSELIIGELLANTVSHAPGLVHFIMEREGEHFRVIVRDSGPGLDVVKSTLPSDPMQEGSRGLFLVHALSVDVAAGQSPEGGAELRVILPLRIENG